MSNPCQGDGRPYTAAPAAGSASNETALLCLVQTVALGTNQASSVEAAAQSCIDAVCAFTGWPVGHLYLRSPDSSSHLSSTNVWHLQPAERFELFRRVTEATPMASGVGLPGRVLASGKAIWVEDVRVDPEFVRTLQGADIGVRASFAFPLMSGLEVVGVLEFFCGDIVAPDPRLLEVAEHIGIQLGVVLQRATAERALRESEVRFRSVAQSANDAIISADAAGRIVFWNRGAAAIFGYTEDEALGQPLTILMPERYQTAHQRGMERLATTGETRVIGTVVELHGLRKDGREFPIELSLGTWTSGGSTFFSGIIRDTSERLRQMRELARSEAERDHLAHQAHQAQEASRTKDEFLATLSHELRTPLMAMLGWSRLLRAGALDEATTARALASIERNTLLQSRLVEDLLDVSRIVAGKLRLDIGPVDLVAVAEAALDMVRPDAEAKGVELAASIAPLPVPVRGDGIRLQQVVLNLLSNAVKFTPGGGRVELAVLAVGSRACIRVSDEGRGIVPEFLPHVFDRFRQADSFMSRGSGGLGLGLAIVRHLTDLHGGSVAAESAGEGMGATFTVELPIDQENGDAAGLLEDVAQEVEA
ncbi:MAG: PAS domain S-box protein [Gemmatimonadetes bacterium]|nr:PAS domain S-box protein [Gemmatimonadota bacterium]